MSYNQLLIHAQDTQKQNTMKTTSFSDGQGRTLFSGVVRPGRMHDRTAVRTEGIAEQFRLRPQVKATADDGYRRLAGEFPDQISAPPKKPGEDAGDGEHRAWREAKRRQSSARICIEHTNAELKKWRPLQRYTGCRATYGETQAAIASLVSDRSARRPTRRRTSTALVPVHTTTCCLIHRPNPQANLPRPPLPQGRKCSRVQAPGGSSRDSP
ncbi:transposase family protein [Streptomyces sp. NPDC088846]|uniref:transposase family protein n=1 Tax=Streptomyces sp. NPDC088846 TaxID=3365908 RepID=UPI0038283291